MKKKLFTLVILLLACIVVVGCGKASGAYDNMGMMPEMSEMMGDEYTEIVENPFISTAQNPNSYFSIDANTASYPNLRKLISMGGYINPDAVRIEEMLNYFSYDYATPTGDDVLKLNASVFDTPYNSQTKLMTVGLAAKEVDFTKQSNNLVFLIDVSGSMSSPDKLGLVQQAFMMLTENLNDNDRVSIVTYAGADRVALSGAFGYEKTKIMSVIEDLYASGSTAGSAGIRTAYDLAERYFITGANNRVILATDGDFNVGTTSISALKRLIKNKSKSGVYLSVFGVGQGNLQADTMEALALNGNGTYSYIDSVKEARRALVEQMGGTLLTVAKDVKAGIAFNPEYVESYRLLGYENKLLTEDEFNSDQTDAGELGSGHQITVVYEVKLTQKNFVAGENLANVEVRFKRTENSGGLEEQSTSTVMGVKTDYYHTVMTENDVFVSSVVEFALIARNSIYKADANINAVIARLDAINFGNDPFKEEFKGLMKTYRDRYVYQQNYIY